MVQDEFAMMFYMFGLWIYLSSSDSEACPSTYY